MLEHGPFDSVMTNFGVLQMPTRFGDLVVERMWAPALRSIPGQNVVAAATFKESLSLVHFRCGNRRTARKNCRVSPGRIIAAAGNSLELGEAVASVSLPLRSYDGERRAFFGRKDMFFDM